MLVLLLVLLVLHKVEMIVFLILDLAQLDNTLMLLKIVALLVLQLVKNAKEISISVQLAIVNLYLIIKHVSQNQLVEIINILGAMDAYLAPKNAQAVLIVKFVSDVLMGILTQELIVLRILMFFNQ